MSGKTGNVSRGGYEGELSLVKFLTGCHMPAKGTSVPSPLPAPYAPPTASGGSDHHLAVLSRLNNSMEGTSVGNVYVLVVRVSHIPQFQFSCAQREDPRGALSASAGCFTDDGPCEKDL